MAARAFWTAGKSAAIHRFGVGRLERTGLTRLFHRLWGAHAPTRGPLGASPAAAASTATTVWRKQAVYDCGEAPQAAREARALPGSGREIAELIRSRWFQAKAATARTPSPQSKTSERQIPWRKYCWWKITR